MTSFELPEQIRKSLYEDLADRPGATVGRGTSKAGCDLPPRAVPHPMLVPAPVEGREGRASSGTRATA